LTARRYTPTVNVNVEVNSYSADYPQVEGGKDSKRLMYEQVAPLGEEIVETFLATNAELIIPA
jgi:hypothetical protein